MWPPLVNVEMASPFVMHLYIDKTGAIWSHKLFNTHSAHEGDLYLSVTPILNASLANQLHFS